jgi:hypothetical protein
MSQFEALTGELRAYCAAHQLPSMSADELAVELSAVLDGEESHYIHTPGTRKRELELIEARAWLWKFCDRWKQAGQCARLGHHDTGRGVCSDCGEFLE